MEPLERVGAGKGVPIEVNGARYAPVVSSAKISEFFSLDFFSSTAVSAAIAPHAVINKKLAIYLILNLLSQMYLNSSITY